MSTEKDPQEEEASDGAGRVVSLFVTSLCGGLVAVGGIALAPPFHYHCRGAEARATSEARARRARCLELGITPEELARREGGR